MGKSTEHLQDFRVKAAIAKVFWIPHALFLGVSPTVSQGLSHTFYEKLKGP